MTSTSFWRNLVHSEIYWPWIWSGLDANYSYLQVFSRSHFKTSISYCLTGLMDIQFSYMRYKLGWGDKAYGWFSGLSYGLTTFAVSLMEIWFLWNRILQILVLYPFLRSKRVTDGILGCAGMVTKIVSLVMLAFLKNEAMAYSIAGDFFLFLKFLFNCLQSSQFWIVSFRQVFALSYQAYWKQMSKVWRCFL